VEKALALRWLGSLKGSGLPGKVISLTPAGERSGLTAPLPAWGVRRLAQSIGIERSEPEIEILSSSRRTFEERGTHSDNEVRNAECVQRLE
jgi:hypothetical protein